jgi:hypothetical protein
MEYTEQELAELWNEFSRAAAVLDRKNHMYNQMHAGLMAAFAELHLCIADRDKLKHSGAAVRDAQTECDKWLQKITKMRYTLADARLAAGLAANAYREAVGASPLTLDNMNN